MFREPSSKPWRPLHDEQRSRLAARAVDLGRSASGGTGSGWSGPQLEAPTRGLRIGSKPLLGDGLVRIDFSKPLDDIPGEDEGWQLSVSAGQVFTFGGNANGLSMR